MKKSELSHLIREEIRRVLKESAISKTHKTINEEAEDRINGVTESDQKMKKILRSLGIPVTVIQFKYANIGKDNGAWSLTITGSEAQAEGWYNKIKNNQDVVKQGLLPIVGQDNSPNKKIAVSLETWDGRNPEKGRWLCIEVLTPERLKHLTSDMFKRSLKGKYFLIDLKS